MCQWLLSVYQPVIAVLSPTPPNRKERMSIMSHYGCIFLSKCSNLPVQLLDSRKVCCKSESLFPVTPPLRVREFCDLAVTLMQYIASWLHFPNHIWPLPAFYSVSITILQSLFCSHVKSWLAEVLYSLMKRSRSKIVLQISGLKRGKLSV